MSGIFDPAIFDSKIFDEGAAASSGAGSGAGSHRLGRRPKKRKIKGVLERIQEEQAAEVLPEPIVEAPKKLAPIPTSLPEKLAVPPASLSPDIAGIGKQLDRIEGTLQLNAEKVRIAKENARVEAARVAKAAEDEEDEFMLLVA